MPSPLKHFRKGEVLALLLREKNRIWEENKFMKKKEEKMKNEIEEDKLFKLREQSFVDFSGLGRTAAPQNQVEALPSDNRENLSKEEEKDNQNKKERNVNEKKKQERKRKNFVNSGAHVHHTATRFLLNL